MGKRLHRLDGEFTELFRTFEHSAFRLETLQWYGVAYEDRPLEQFLAGESITHDPSKDEWCGVIRDAVTAGRRMERVHVVVEPLTDYLRYEMHSYAPNVRAGEDIRLIPVRDGEWPTDLPRRHDFWLFDSRDLWVMQYAADGRFLYAEHREEPTEVVEANWWRDVAMHGAISYETFTSSRS